MITPSGPMPSGPRVTSGMVAQTTDASAAPPTHRPQSDSPATRTCTSASIAWAYDLS